MSANEKECVEKKYVLMAPDGGWGYMIAIAVTIMFTSFTMFLPCFGLLFDRFMKEIGMSSTQVTVLFGINTVCFAISGYLASPLLSIISFRKLVFMGSALVNFGMLGTVFSTSVFTFILCQGVLVGTGFGMVFNLSNTMINNYFVKKRLMAISVVQTVIAIVTLMTPLFLQWSLEKYGFRSTMLLISGVTLQSFVGVALIQPLEWHLKKVEVSADSTGAEIKQPLLIDNTLHEKPTTPIVRLPDVEGNITCPNEQPYDHELSLGKENINPIKKVFAMLLDKELSKTFLMSCISMGPALCACADSTFGLMLPQALYKAHWNQDNVALALSLLNFGDLAMRVILIFFSNWLIKLGTQEMYLMGVLIGVVSRLGLLWSKNEIAVFIYIVFVGVSHCCMMILVPVVIADAVPADKFSAAMGMYMMLCGCMNMVLGPTVGAVRDLTDSYGAAFYIIVSCFAMTILFWSIELCYKRNKHKRVQRLEYLKQKKLNKG